MYNLLVTADEKAWENSSYIYDRSRFLEYTNDKISKEFEKLTENNIQIIKTLPCLFAYEGKNTDLYLGFIKSIKDRNNGKNLLIEFEIIKNIIIPFSSLSPLADLLDIRTWEMNRTHWAIKDDNLLDRLISSNIVDKHIIESLFIETKTSSHLTSDTDKSSEIKVSTIRGFIDKVLTNDINSQVELFYRGHSNKDTYKLEPSLFRKDKQGNYLYLDSEDILYRELISSNSSDFIGDQYTVDKLMRMQHYSLPTRLLDITSNPLIALYFACKSITTKKGEVIIFKINKASIKYFDSDTASCIANLVRLPKHEKDSIQFGVTKEKFNSLTPIKRLLHFIREEKTFFNPEIEPSDLKKIICIKGKKNNDRVSSQSGAFLLFGIDSIFNEIGIENIEVTRITIDNKVKILKELDQLNINESTVFPYIENSAKYVANKFKFNA